MSVPSIVRRWSALLAVLVLALAACGGGEDGAADQAPASTETAPVEPTEAGTETEMEQPATTEPADDATAAAASPPSAEGTADAGAAGGTMVAVASTDLGDVLVDSEGRTLYLFTPDEQGASTCYDQCEQNWPPLVADGDVTVSEDLDQELFSTAARDDGTEQVTANGWPLYLFAGDSAAGDVNGQGVNDVWFAVTPSGEAVSG